MSNFVYAIVLNALMSWFSVNLKRKADSYNGEIQLGPVFLLLSMLGWILGVVFLICLFFKPFFSWYDPVLIYLSGLALSFPLDIVHSLVTARSMAMDLLFKVASAVGIIIVAVLMVRFVVS